MKYLILGLVSTFSLVATAQTSSFNMDRVSVISSKRYECMEKSGNKFSVLFTGYSNGTAELTTSSTKYKLQEQGGCMALGCPTGFSSSQASITIYPTGYTSRTGSRVIIKIGKVKANCR